MLSLQDKFQKCVVRTTFDIYVLLLSLDRYLCWWTISPRGYYLSSNWIDTSAGGLLVLEGIICPVTGSRPLLVDY